MDIRRQIRGGERYLGRVDPVLSGLISQYGPCSLMQEPKPHFHTLVWAIINQQLSVKAAQSIERRLLEYLNTDIVRPEHFHAVRQASLRRCGLSGAKIRYILEASRRVRAGRLDLESLESLDDVAAATRLMTLPGVGRWTADMLLIFSLGHLDVLPIGDLALRKSIQAHYGVADADMPDACLRIADSWRPYRSIASWYYWAAVD